MNAQTDSIPYATYTTKAARQEEWRSLVRGINAHINSPLTDDTESNWEDAFGSMELIRYRSARVDSRIQVAVNSIKKRSVGFQRALLELLFTLYPAQFTPQVSAFIKQTNTPKLFAMGAEYIFSSKKDKATRESLLKELAVFRARIQDASADPILVSLENRLTSLNKKTPPVQDLFNPEFLKTTTVLFSFQRKNRNYPGLAMVRGKNGHFIKDETGNYFSVPQLARSMSNMPGYITNGNTPQGIFKITGFDVSRGSFIGPTTNIQMVLPYEKSPDVHDSITRSLGDNYKNLLPNSWQQFPGIFEAYYAGKAGRTEIIAHGTTVNPAYYRNKPWYPVSPTQGCLCTKEIWSELDGKRLQSDQQKLVNALKKAGGADGYCVVIEIDDQQKPVSLADILKYLQKYDR